MKKAMVGIVFMIIVMVLGTALAAEDLFLGVPVLPGAETPVKTKTRLEMLTPWSHDQVVDYYRKAFQEIEFIKFRDWADQTYIEDDTNLPWHSVTVSKQQENGKTSVVIVKDNWTWIIGTLILRFTGVFVVLLVLYAAMAISGAIISRSVKKVEAEAK
ncbi:MAG: hypothetical protein JW821_13650 [Deltaproteobacteria bacterium]|nr:hypothetical protein [Deltaproteobacteria bacterium]